MKKIYSMRTMAMMAITAMTMSSCDEDIAIATTLEGTWRGDMYVSSYWNGRDYYATATEITFNGDPFSWTRGTGYWVDYYSGAPWDYVANHIEWHVVNRNIEVYFVEEGTAVVIGDYRLTDNYFSGYIEDGDNDVEFRLRHIDSPNWDSYDRWGYDSWYGNYYYRTRSDAAAVADTMSTKRPVRQFAKTK